MSWNSGPCLACEPARELIVALSSEMWSGIVDALGGYAHDAEDLPWAGECHGCDTAESGVCSQHQEVAEHGAKVRALRDEIVRQLGAQTSTTADLGRGRP